MSKAQAEELPSAREVPIPGNQKSAAAERAPVGAEAPSGAPPSATSSLIGKIRGVPGLVANIWKQDDQKPKFPHLTEDLQTDVCIIGAGITGLSTAYNLLEAGKRVVVLDARVRGGGMSGRMDGMLSMWNDDYYSKLEAEWGQATITKMAASQENAIAFVEKLVAAEGIDCGFTRVPGYLVPHSLFPSAHKLLEQEAEAARHAGLRDVKLVQLPGSQAAPEGSSSVPEGGNSGVFSEAVHFPGCAQLDPVAYINGLADAVARKGGQIYEMSRVLSTSPDKVVRTSSGGSVRCGALVFASFTPLSQNLAVHSRQRPMKEYHMAFSVPKGSVMDAQYYDTFRGHHLLRPYHRARLCPWKEQEAVGKELLLVSGEAHNTGLAPSSLPDSYKRLEEWARFSFPQVQEAVCRWTAQVYEPIDRKPLIGQDPLNHVDEVYVATGDSGQGVLVNSIASSIISDLILNKPNPYTDVYEAGRYPPLHDAEETITQGRYFLTIAQQFAERLLPRSFSELKGMIGLGDIEDLKPGQGTVCQQGLHKVALYVDEDGQRHTRSAVCTHMGCLLRWNPSDKTFECPCHGSCYDGKGASITGPSRADLKAPTGLWLV